MTDLAIAALSGAGVTIAVVVGMLVLGLRTSDAERRATDAATDAATRKAQNAVDATAIASLRSDLETERARANALDDELSKASADPDPAGARERVLARWAAGRKPSAGNAAGSMLAASASVASDLAKPGD